MSGPDAGAAGRREILEYAGRGLATEEVLDLWDVAFPGSSNVRLDDEDEDSEIHRSEHGASVDASRPFE